MSWQYEYRGRLYDYHWVYNGQEKVANWVESYFDRHTKKWVPAHLFVVNVKV